MSVADEGGKHGLAPDVRARDAERQAGARWRDRFPAAAYDLRDADEYRDAVIEGLDYLLGRNALKHSYITGYGAAFSQNQHSRIYAAELNAALPHPPRGSLAGGANSPLEDPVAIQKLGGCVGQFCYIDEIGSYSTNEVAINWNAPLAWVAAFVAAQPACR